MIGILCEKPSAARNFAKALGGISGTFDGEQYKIVNSIGHIYEFIDPSEMVDESKAARYKSWDVSLLPWDETDFSWKKKQKKDTSDVIKNIREGLKGCDEICIATDVDPTGEGELLAWEILDGLHLHPKKWSRIYHEDEEVKSIQKAFRSRKQLKSMESDMDYVKADFRSKWDFCSMQWTRIASRYGDGRSVLRQGRLKSAMVLLVGDQLKAVADYVPIPFYQNRFKDENGVIYVSKDEPTFSKKEDVPASYSDSPVIKDSAEKKTTPPPKLMDLAALSARLTPKGFKAKEILDTYQKMYENHIVSYPRTEDKFISPEQFKEALGIVDKVAACVGVDKKLLTHRTPRSTHVKSGGSHGANRPASNVPKSLNDLSEYGRCAPAIYELLAHNFLAMFAEDYEYLHETGHVKKYPKFIGQTNIPLKNGWKDIYSLGDDEDDASGKHIGTHAEPFVYEGVNPKPPAPTTKWLMKQLEKHDVGTGATRVSIYSEVTSEKAKYPLLIEKKGKLSMSPYGEMSYALLPGTHIGDLKITEMLQEEMREVSAGKKNPEDCLKEIRQMIIDDREVMQKNGEKLGKVSTAPVKEKYEGEFNGSHVSFTRVWGGHRFTDEECEKLCRGEEISFDAGKDGKSWEVSGKLAEQTYNGHKFIGFLRNDVPASSEKKGTSKTSSKPMKVYKCPNCGKEVHGHVSSYGEFYKCDGCGLLIPRMYLKHKFTDKELKTLFDGKETGAIEMESRKTGKKFKAKLSVKGEKLNFNFQ